MSHTNSTTNYSLPQFLTTDKPAWLTDVNNAYLAIDTAMKNNADAASTADTKATNAGTAATNADTKATAAKAAADGAIASISDAFSDTNTYIVGDVVIYNNLLYRCKTAVTTPGAWTGSDNWERITIEDLIDTVKSSVATNATAISTINSFLSDSSLSINRATGIPNTVPVPNGDKTGHVCGIHFALQLPARTYTAGEALWQVDNNSLPHIEQHFICLLGSDPVLLRINTNGSIVFNNTFTLSTTKYLIGEAFYIAL